MTFDVMFFLVSIPLVVIAAVSKAGFGSGADFAIAAILVIFVDPELILGIALPLLILVDLVILKPYWRAWRWREAKLLIVGAVPGVGLGIWLYQVANADGLRLLIGVVAVGFVGFQLVMSKSGSATKPPPASVGLLTGILSGFTSFISHAGGPPVVSYLLAQKMSKGAYQATTVLVFWWINLLKFAPYAYLGIFSADTLKADLYLAPFVLFGSWLGVKTHRIVPERLFFAFTYIALTLAGLKLIWDALA